MKRKRFLVNGSTGEILQEKEIILEEGEHPQEYKTFYPDELVIEKINGKLMSFQMNSITLFNDKVIFKYWSETEF